VQIAAANLALLIGKDPSEQIVTRGDPPLPEVLPDLVSASRIAMESRPEILVLQTALEREALVEKQAKKGRLPDLDIGVARHWIDGEGSFWDVTLSVPLPIFQQQFNGEIAEARANQRAIDHELAYLKARVALEVKATHSQALAARDRVDLYSGTLLEEAKEVYEMYVFSYEHGEINGLELNAARSSLVETYTEFAQATYDYSVAVATLQRAIGQESEGVQP